MLLPQGVEESAGRRGQLALAEAVGVEQEAGLQLLHGRDQAVEAAEELELSRLVPDHHVRLLGKRNVPPGQLENQSSDM